MRASVAAVTFVAVVGLRPLAPGVASDSLPLPEDGIVASEGLPAEIMALLKETKDNYGSDALLLQLQLLHYAIRAGSTLTAGVRVRGVEAHLGHRYLVFFVETGIIFNSRETHRRQRVSRLWSEIVTPAVERLTSCEVPAEGIALELLYSHRLFRDAAELENTATEDPGRYQQLTVYLLRDDVLAFLKHDIDARKLFSRSEAQVRAPIATPELDP
jgi:hypothetical protein